MSALNALERTPPVSASLLSRPRRVVRRHSTVQPRVGALVQVARGPAAGARGRVRRCAHGRATLLAVMLTRRPFLLTVDVDDCVALPDAA